MPKIEAPHTDDGKDLPGGDKIEGQEENEVLDLEKSYQSLFDKRNDFVGEKLKTINPKYHNEIAIKLLEAGNPYIESWVLYTFKDLSQDVALKFIEAGQCSGIAKNLSSFKDLDHNEIAHKLIEAGYGHSVAENLSSFNGINHEEIARKLIEAGKAPSLIEYLSSFNDIDYEELARKLVELGLFELFAQNLYSFKDLSQEVAVMLIESKKGYYVLRNLTSFKDLDLNEIAYKSLEAGCVYNEESFSLFNGINHEEIANKFIVVGDFNSLDFSLFFLKDLSQDIAFKLIDNGHDIGRYISSFNDVNHNEIAHKLIEAGYGHSVAENLSSFNGINHEEIARKLIEEGEVQSIVRCLSNFKDLNQDIAIKLIEEGYGQSLVRNLLSFKDVHHNEVALKLIENGNVNDVVACLGSFRGLNKDTAIKLIENGYYYSVVNEISSFQDLNQEFALKLIESNCGDFVSQNISHFKDTDHNEIALQLIERGYSNCLIQNLSNFKNINHNYIALEIIEKGDRQDLARNLSSFKDINDNEIALKLIEWGEDYLVIKYFLSLENVNHTEIVFKLIEAGKGNYVAEYLDHFENVDHNDIALKLVENGKDEYIAEYIYHFTDLNYKVLLSDIVERKKFSLIIRCGSKFGKDLEKLPFWGDIYKMQPPSNNEDNDPWKKHLNPLLANAFGEDGETLENEQIKNEVLKYIKNFGLVYVPYLFDIFRKIIGIDEIDEETKKELRIFGINPNLQRDAILLELNKVAKGGYTNNILNGDVPESLDTSLGKALFIKEFVPQSSFDRGYNNWKDLGLKALESYTIPSYIRRQEIELLDKGDMNDLDAEVLHKKRQEIFENTETATRFEAFKGYIEDTNNGFTIFNVQEAVQKRIISQQELIAKKDVVKDVKVIESIQKAIDKDLLLLKNLEEVVLGVTGEGPLANNAAMYARLVELSAERNNKEENLNRFLRACALTDIMDGNQGLRTLFHYMFTKDTIDAEYLRILSDFTSHSIDHEYLDKQENGFSEDIKIRIRTLLMANKVYKVSFGKDGGDMSLDYFTKILKDLEKIDNPTGNRVLSKVAFVPVNGLGRITAGNVGDACYTSQTERLSDGDFQNTHMMMITKESKDGAKHIVGSVIGIQAQEVESGVPVYVIRANNPQENYLSSIDVDSYVEASLQACIQQAVDIRNENLENGSDGDIKVCMPMESSSNAAMTNRPRVHERMHKKFSSCERVGLNSNDDTNFNGYDIWNKNSSHAVVCVYEIKNGVEYYYGNHADEKQHELFGVYHDTEVFVPEWKNKLEQIKKNVLRPR